MHTALFLKKEKRGLLAQMKKGQLAPKLIKQIRMGQ